MLLHLLHRVSKRPNTQADTLLDAAKTFRVLMQKLNKIILHMLKVLLFMCKLEVYIKHGVLLH